MGIPCSEHTEPVEEAGGNLKAVPFFCLPRGWLTALATQLAYNTRALAFIVLTM